MEIDGDSHSRPTQLSADLAKEQFLRDKGIRVLRISAADVQETVETALYSVLVGLYIQDLSGEQVRLRDGGFRFLKAAIEVSRENTIDGFEPDESEQRIWDFVQNPPPGTITPDE